MKKRLKRFTSHLLITSNYFDWLINYIIKQVLTFENLIFVKNIFEMHVSGKTITIY
jgi:hypothetical protein